jgi:hypothetical protein
MPWNIFAEAAARSAIVWLLCLVGSPASAAAILSGSVSVNQGPLLTYTYSYAVDNTNGTADIDAFAVLVTYPNETSQFLAFPPVPPLSSTSPSGWTLVESAGADLEPGLSGGFYEWAHFTPGTPIPIGATLDGFSFTVYVPPSGISTDNYFLYSISNNAPGPFGNVVAPDMSSVPEPSPWAMLLIGFAGLGLIAFRRKPRASISLNTRV